MSEEDEGQDKPHDPSERRLQMAREKGEIPRSQELLGAASLFGLLIALATMGGQLVETGGSAMKMLIGRAGDLSIADLGTQAGWGGQVAGAVWSVLIPVLILFIAPIAMIFAYLMATDGLTVSPNKLMPKLSRISPLAAAKQKFGIEGLFDFARNSLKMAIAMILFGVLLAQSGPRLVAMMWLSAGQWSAEMAWLTLKYLALALLLTVVFGGGDYLWQVYRHIVRNRMSRKDMQDEGKESDGDPHAKQERRRRGHEIAMNRMFADVAGADVVIVNPTHYAVALKWSRKRGSAPVCLAKGADDIAACIRAKAAEAGVPLHSDPPTARLLFATVEIGQEIQPEHYAAVAAAIRFADQLRKRKRLWTR
jgi:flagellar biosynthetic protein FlhB